MVSWLHLISELSALFEHILEISQEAWKGNDLYRSFCYLGNDLYRSSCYLPLESRHFKNHVHLYLILPEAQSRGTSVKPRPGSHMQENAIIKP